MTLLRILLAMFTGIERRPRCPVRKERAADLGAHWDTRHPLWGRG